MVVVAEAADGSALRSAPLAEATVEAATAEAAARVEEAMVVAERAAARVEEAMVVAERTAAKGLRTAPSSVPSGTRSVNAVGARGHGGW